LESDWAWEPVTAVDKLTLERCSIGIERSIAGAGSFGGFLKRTSIEGEVYGITAAHCLPGGLTGMPVCSPSTLEVTGRLKSLLRYTTFGELSDRVHITPIKEAEAHTILGRFQFHDCPAGVRFCDPTNKMEPKTGLLSGANLGSIARSRFGPHSDLLHRYDQELRRKCLPHFSAKVSWLTRLDWLIFRCNWDRYGENIYQGDRISDVGDLYPGLSVQKIGRSTGVTCGKVNRATLIHWDNGAPTHEIAIIAPRGKPFASSGDPGGCVFGVEDGQYKAAGLLIGKAVEANIAFATPLYLILQMAGDYHWA
jgi:hypothetical protein